MLKVPVCYATALVSTSVAKPMRSKHHTALACSANWGSNASFALPNVCETVQDMLA